MMKEGVIMRIDAYNQISNYYNTTVKKSTQKASVKGSTTDQVSFSSIGKDMQTAKAALAKTPDIREDVVAEYKAKIASGDYHVSGESFADKLLAAYGAK